MLVTKLLNSHSSANSEFVAGRLAFTKEQWDLYVNTLDSRPMVSCWITSGYEISFISVPTVFLYVCNNKSMYDNFDFARSKIQRQVDMGNLSKVSWKPLVINPINVVWTNK